MRNALAPKHLLSAKVAKIFHQRPTSLRKRKFTLGQRLSNKKFKCNEISVKAYRPWLLLRCPSKVLISK